MGKILAIIGGVVVVLLLILVPILVLIFVPTEALQKASYLAIIVTSVFACGLLLVTIALVAVIAVLVSVITRITDQKVGPLLDKVNETADSAKGTIAYVGEGVVSPLVKLAAILAGIRAAIRALFQGGRV